MLSDHSQLQGFCPLPVISLSTEGTMNYDCEKVKRESVHMECKVMLSDVRVHSKQCYMLD